VRRAWQVNPELAYVEFVARSRLLFRGQRLHETSRFVFEEGRWWYVDGDVEQRG
jgi:SEC-C motif-containing protein